MGLVISILVHCQLSNKGKKIICTSIERTHLRQIKIVIKIIIKKQYTRFFFQRNKIKNAHTFPTGLAICKVQSHFQSYYLLKFSPTKVTNFSRLCQNPSCVQTSEINL